MSIFKVFKIFVSGVVTGALFAKLFFWVWAAHPIFTTTLLAQIIGGLVVAFFSYIYLLRFEGLFSKPNLSFCFTQNGVFVDILTPIEAADKCILDFRISVKNTGDKTLRKEEGFWHLLILGDYETTQNNSVDPVNAKHFRDVNKLPVFSNSTLDLDSPIKITFDKEAMPTIKLYGWFNTEYGSYPKNARTYNMDLNNYFKISVKLS